MVRQQPHNGSQAQEFLDIVLTVAAFDQQVSLLFCDQGVLHLKKAQQPESLALQDTSAIFKALEIYDIRQIYVEIESMQDFGLRPGDLIIPVQEIYRKEIKRIMHQQQIII